MSSSHSTSQFADVREQLIHECSAMARYALASGMSVPPHVMVAIETARSTPSSQPLDMSALTRAHVQLSRLVAPATPRALLLMGDEHATSRLSWLGHVGIVRRMMAAAVLSVIAFLAVSLSTVTSTQTNLMAASGWTALGLEVLYLSAAAMGASFAMLMQVSNYIVRRTYDPKYEPTYWIKFLLGIMAGVFLVSLVPVRETNGPGLELGNATIAMLGGFSASAVFRILTRLVATVESFFRPGAKEEAAQRESAAQLRANEDLSQARLSLAGQLVRLQQQVSAGARPEELSGALQQILHGLVPEGSRPAGTAEETPAGTIALPGISIVETPAPDVEEDAAGSTEDAPAASVTTAPVDQAAAG